MFDSEHQTEDEAIPAGKAKQCTYCGDEATHRDHVVSASRIGVRSFDFGPIVHACASCNTILGDVQIFTIEGRAAYVLERVWANYSKTLASVEWSNDEIDEMGERMRQRILQRDAAKRRLQARVKRLERVASWTPGTTLRDDEPSWPAFEHETHRIEIAEVGFNNRGTVFRVWHNGEELIGRAREPLFEACRVLAARGLRGTLEMVKRGTTVVRMRTDIVKGARLTISEPDNGRIKATKWSPRETTSDEAD